MAHWNTHALGHASQIEAGYFVSPLTNEVMKLSWAESKIAETIMRRLPTTEASPWGDQIGYSINNKNLTAWAGKRISSALYASAIRKLELAGIIEVVRDLGESHKIKIGRLLRCDLNNCFEPLHYPGRYPLEKPSTPLENIRSEVIEPEETPLIHRDIKNLNKPLITLNTFNEDSEILESSQSEPIEEKEIEATLETKDLEQVKPLPPGWANWIRETTKRQGLETPRPSDIGHAWATYEETGLDLQPGGDWFIGRPSPKPEQQLKTGTN